jgi:hypothetical protein
MSQCQLCVYYVLYVLYVKCIYRVKLFKVILYQFWVKNFPPWKFNLEYGGTFTKLFIHVSSWNMFPTIRNV